MRSGVSVFWSALAVSLVGLLAVVIGLDAAERQYKKEKTDQAFAIAEQIADVSQAVVHRRLNSAEVYQAGLFRRRSYRTPSQPASQTAVDPTRSEELVPLPEVETLPWTTLTLHRTDWKNDPASVALVNWLTHDEQVSLLRTKTRFTLLYHDDPRYTEEWSTYTGNVFPTLVVQHPSGAVVYKCSAQAMPESPEELIEHLIRGTDQANRHLLGFLDSEVSELCGGIFRRRHCPGPDPGPVQTPEPEKTVENKLPAIPDTQPKKESPVDQAPYWLLGLVIAFGTIGVAVALELRSHESID